MSQPEEAEPVIPDGATAAYALAEGDGTTVAGPTSPTQAAAPPTRSPGIPRYLQIAGGIVLSLGALLLLKEFGSTFAPMFLALNLMVTAYPLHTWLVRKGCPSPLSAVTTALVVFVVLLAMVAGLVWSVNETVTLLPQYADEFTGLFNWFIDRAAQLGFDQASLMQAFKSIDPNSIFSAASSVLNGASGFVAMLAILVTTLVFMAMDTSGFAARIRIAGATHSRMVTGLVSFSRGIRRYWVVTSVFGLIVAVLDVIAVAIIGVPLPIVWGLLSFLTNYIPNIGFVVGLIPPALVALVALGWKQALVVVVLYCVLNFVVQSIIQPRFTGESVGVTPTISFISLLVWGLVLGGLGTLLALPMTLLVKALIIDTDPRARWVNAFIASNPGDAQGAAQQAEL
ncbi:AI-2E family transporter [Propionibacterium freudenreichii]|uniref:AI-2E family transporter n=1 Tax=Propionibacterium freudenreichii TaxID=1744 RepID=UPI00254FC19B|nr:AI-2E family transporter [Propionibacterium freudenreichii]MDK9661882.1 AI-2E family transporter [Propionibacterium freudenreichii]